MDAKKTCAALALFAVSASFCHAGHTGKIRFIGAVVEAGCWNRTGTQEITCERNHTTTHYQTASARTLSLTANNATVTTRYLDSDSLLEQIQIDYD